MSAMPGMTSTKENLLKNNGRVIQIDRSIPFDPVALLGEGWSVLEEDEHSLSLTEVDLTKVSFKTMLKEGEKSMFGEEKLKRLIASSNIRLDAKIFQILWENQDLIPEVWKQLTNGNTTSIFFDGTILQNLNGHRFVLALHYRDGQWHWHCYWFDKQWTADYLSAVLAS